MAHVVAQYVRLDGTKVTDEIIGAGGTGLVVRRGPHAVKKHYISRKIEIDENSILLNAHIF